MAQIPITVVRYPEKQARDIFAAFIFGSRYTPPRPPRGIPPALVARFLETELKPETAPLAYQRALEAMRFYETTGLGPHFRKILAAAAGQAYRDARRAAFVLQMLGDLGTPEDSEWGADYLDRQLLPRPDFPDIADLLLETLLALAPAGGLAAFAARLRTDSGKLREIADNRLPGAADLIAAKKRLLASPASAPRRQELIAIYLGQSDLSEPYLVTWAARMLRREAMEGGPAAICAGFGQAIDALASKENGDSQTGFEIVRAAQAILYLQGKLTPQWSKLYARSHPERAQNFLSDDMPM